jgi:ABC-type branched-subunit amino acid transport system substrate-binding protein
VSPFGINRRQVLLAGGAALVAGASHAQPGKNTGTGSVTIAQMFDASAGQQDVSKDFLIGSRAAWQDINARGGIRGRHVQHLNIEVDGSLASVKAAIASIRNDASCLALCGTTGDIAASRSLEVLRTEQLAIAHVAPWLQNSSTEVDERTFPIFAARQEQVAYALKSLSVMSVTELGVVFASDQEEKTYHDDIARAAADMKVRLQTFRAGGDLLRLGQKLGPGSPAILLFVGGTPELVPFTQGLERQARQRYVIALADVNLQTMIQMGAARGTPVIATQAVPTIGASLPIVRMYRDVLGRLFDEPPTALSLAGFIAARYAYEVLSDIDGPLMRQSALAAFQRHTALDVGGFRVAFGARRRSGTYVTQSMLTQDGRVIG